MSRLRNPGSRSSTMSASVSSSRRCVTRAVRAQSSRMMMIDPKPAATPVRTGRGSSTSQSMATTSASPIRETVSAIAIRRPNSTRTSFLPTNRSLSRKFAPRASGRTDEDDGERSLIYFSSDSFRPIHSAESTSIMRAKNSGEDHRSTSLMLATRALRSARNEGTRSKSRR